MRKLVKKTSLIWIFCSFVSILAFTDAGGTARAAALNGKPTEDNAAEALVSKQELSSYAGIINGKLDRLYEALGISEVTVKDFILLKDFGTDEYAFISVNFYPTGYAIFDRETGEALQRSPGGVSPYSDTDAAYYYAGFGTYAYKAGNAIYDLKEHTPVDQARRSEYAQRASAFRQEVSERTAAPAAVTRASTDNFIDDGIWGLYFPFALSAASQGGVTNNFGDGTDRLFGKNFNNSCGQVAAGMLVQYYKRLGHYDTYPSGWWLNPGFYNLAYIRNEDCAYDGTTKKYMTLYNMYIGLHLNSTAEMIHQYIRLLQAPTQPNGATFSNEIKSGLNAFFNAAGIRRVTAVNKTGSVKSFIKAAIDSNDPAIIVTALAPRYSWHCMVVYGYSSTSLDSVSEYICHTGWDDEEKNNIYLFGNSMVYMNRLFSINEGAVKLQF